MAAGIAWSDALLTSIPHQSLTLRMFFGFAREIVGVQPTKKNSLGTHRVPGVMTPTGMVRVFYMVREGLRGVFQTSNSVFISTPSTAATARSS